MSDRPIIVAHRGLHVGTGFPENSIAALTAAWRAGIAWCECDVHFSADGVPFVLHDETLDRTTNGSGPIAARTALELREVLLRDAGGRVTEHRLLRLDGVLAAKPSGAGLFIEIKPDTDRGVELARQLAGDLCQFLAFPIGTVRSLFDAGFGAFTWVGVESESQRAAMFDLPIRGLQIRHDWVDAALMAETRKRGLDVAAWTVNAVSEVRRLAELGVWSVTSDEPVLLKTDLVSAVRNSKSPSS